MIIPMVLENIEEIRTDWKMDDNKFTVMISDTIGINDSVIEKKISGIIVWIIIDIIMNKKIKNTLIINILESKTK